MQLKFSALRSAAEKWLPYGLLLGELAFSSLVVVAIPYTEIDWIAYMQEVEGWAVEGSTNYFDLRGDTGPLVYPAGFLYIYRFLRWITGGGRGPAAIRLAQWAFVALYVATLAVMVRIYKNAKLGSPWLIGLLCVSKRVHSLFMLRLFNDCWAMLFVYAAVLLCQKHKWLLATLTLSLATSIKMNALLFLPGLLFLLVRNVGILRSAAYLLAAVALQIGIGAPFLLTHPGPYMAKAFEMSRVFFHTWTVNWKMLPEDVFVSPRLATALLLAHAATLIIFGAYRWCEHDGGLVQVLARVGALPRFAVPALQRVAELLGVAPTVSSAEASADADAGFSVSPSGARIEPAASAHSHSPVQPAAMRLNSDRDDPMSGAAHPSFASTATSTADTGTASGAAAVDANGVPIAAGGVAGPEPQLRGSRAEAAARKAPRAAARAAGTSAGAATAWTVGTSPAVTSDSSGGSTVISSGGSGGAFADGPVFIAYVLFAANFAGIAFARTLHYQFYSWYFHTLPLLFAAVRLPAPAMAALLLGIEYAFNVGDAAGAGSALSSTVLQICHFALLGALLSAPAPNPRAGIVVAQKLDAPAAAGTPVLLEGKKKV